MAAWVAVAAVAGLTLISFADQGRQWISDRRKDYAAKKSVLQQMVDTIEEVGFIPNLYRIRGSNLNSAMPVPRIAGDPSQVEPSALSRLYTKATVAATARFYDAAQNNPDRAVTTPVLSTRVPLLHVTNRALVGSLADYPMASFDRDRADGSEPIENRMDIFKDKMGSAFPGPHNASYQDSVAPDRLRNPWAPDGLLSREFLQQRVPVNDARPAIASIKSREVPRGTKPWERYVSRR